MTTDTGLLRAAVRLLSEDRHYLADARQGARVGNTVVGGVLAWTYQCPRWAAENAVAQALVELAEPEAKS